MTEHINCPLWKVWKSSWHLLQVVVSTSNLSPANESWILPPPAAGGGTQPNHLGGGHDWINHLPLISQPLNFQTCRKDLDIRDAIFRWSLAVQILIGKMRKHTKMMLWFELRLSYRNCNYCASCPISLKKIPALCFMRIAYCIKKSIGCWRGQGFDFSHQHWPLHCCFMLCIMRILKEIC